MILDIDIGNTRVKWILSNSGIIVERGALDEHELEALFKSLANIPQAIARLRVASVRPSLHERLNQYSWQYCCLQPEYAVVEKQFGNLVNAYEDVSQMGVDRWLAIIAASAMCDGACIVVSAGTAVTVDLLDADKRHKGGFIAPGLRLMRQSLYLDTDQVKLESIDQPAKPEPGVSTHNAVSNGLLLMQMGLVEKSIELLAANQPTLLLTGGDGAQLEKCFLASSNIPALKKIVFEPDLVFRGLSVLMSS